MNLTEAIQHIERIPTRQWDGLSLHIVTTSPGGIGGTPSVGVSTIHAGIDWDGSKLLIYPAQPLTRLTTEQVAALVQSVRTGNSWHAYQQHKRLADRIAELERELAALKGAA